VASQTEEGGAEVLVGVDEVRIKAQGRAARRLSLPEPAGGPQRIGQI
jgi:hypothetical protein